MKIFRLCPTPAHASKIRDAYRLTGLTFAKQLQIYRSENLLLPGGWASCMEEEGFEVFETCCDDMYLQESWAIENNGGYLVRGHNPLLKILEMQIKVFNPDILFLYAGASFIISRQMRDAIREVSHKNMSIVVFWGDEIPPGETYSGFFGDIDLAFCSSTIYQNFFEGAGIKAFTIGNAFDPSLKYEIPPLKKHNFIFCGTAGFCIPDHWHRFNLIKKLLNLTCLDVYSNERANFPKIQKGFRDHLRDLILLISTKLPRQLIAVISLHPRLSRLMNLALQAKAMGVPVEILKPLPELKGEHPMLHLFRNEKSLASQFPVRVKSPKVLVGDYLKLLAESRIVLNIHRSEEADIGNIRCFEATGVGSCLLTDHREGLRYFFDVDNDIVTFETPEECVEKVRYLLENPLEAERIAKNGRLATLSRHTVAARCKKIAEILRQEQKKKEIVPKVLFATYDLEYYPLSYDIAFFIQAAEVERKNLGCNTILLNIIAPQNIDNQAGVSKEVYSVVDGRAREFRLNNICVQMAQLMPSVAGITIKYEKARNVQQKIENLDVIEYPIGRPGHNNFYKLLNKYPSDVAGFTGSIEAHRFISKWLQNFADGRKVICVSLRQYQVDKERNSNIAEWARFLEWVDKREYAIVVLPDTDHIADFYKSPLGIYPTFEPACFQVDLRMALYEASYLNMFVSNGPAFAATLFKGINYLMFKIMQPDIPLVSSDTLKWLGYEIGGTPKYATIYQRWVWESDTADVLYREFLKMDKLLRMHGPI